MYDIDPPARVLRLDAPRKGTQPTALTDKQFMAIRDALSVTPETLAAIVGNWIHASQDIERIKAIAQADADLAYALDSAL